MKEQTNKQLKNIFKAALAQYFQQSGINEILIELYKKSQLEQQIARQPKKVTKVQNILRKNEVEVSKSQSRLGLMKEKGLSQLKSSYVDEDEQQEFNTPMLSALQNSISQDYNSNVDVRIAMNENVDPLQQGLSVLDANLPDFLAKGLKKVGTTNRK